MSLSEITKLRLFLGDAACAKDGDAVTKGDDFSYYESNEIVCRLCDRRILSSGKHLPVHGAIARGLLDLGLTVPNHNCQVRIQKLIENGLRMVDLQAAGAEFAFSVWFGPRWFTDLIGGWMPVHVVVDILLRIPNEPKLCRALEAVAETGEIDAVDLLAAQQYPNWLKGPEWIHLSL